MAFSGEIELQDTVKKMCSLDNIKIAAATIRQSLLDLDSEFDDKGPVKLIERVKIAHSFLQSVSNQFHIIILSMPI